MIRFRTCKRAPWLCEPFESMYKDDHIAKAAEKSFTTRAEWDTDFRDRMNVFSKALDQRAEALDKSGEHLAAWFLANQAKAARDLIHRNQEAAGLN